MELFFTPPENIKDHTAEFDRFEARHILKTLHKSQGDTFNFTDGEGHLFTGTITTTKPVLTVHHKLVEQLPPPPVIINLAVGFIRHNRMDFIIEKATEIGVQKFYLLTTAYSNYFTANITRWQKIARQAVKQSTRLFLPEIMVLKSLVEFVSMLPSPALKIVLDQHAARQIPEILSATGSLIPKNIVILIGPEGGLASDELKLIGNQDFTAVSLGKYRLRTETAVLVATAAFSLFVQ